MSARPPDPRDEVQTLANDAVTRLAADLKVGRSETLKDYLAAMGRFHKYSWTNALLIHQQRPTATRVAGYHTWHELGRHVRRGEKGIRIYAPLITKARVDQSARVTGGGREPLETSTAEKMHVEGFRVAYVFDVTQTDGKPLPEFARTQGDPQDFTAKLKIFVAERGIALQYDPSIAPADGISTGGMIRLRPGLLPAEEFSVLAHELAHEILHQGPGEPSRSGLSKVVRETQAEAVAFVVSRGIGLETGTAAADYIALYDGNSKTLAESLAVIQETASRILKELLPEERRPEGPTRAAPSAPSPEKPREESGSRPTDSAPDRSPAAPSPLDSVSLDR